MTPPPERAAWPFCGRDAELATIAACYADPDVGGIIITGGAGVGKTAIAHAAARSIPAPRVVRICGNPALADVPFGALAPVIRPAGSGAPEELDRSAIVASLMSEDGRLALVVDDPASIDAGSLGIAVQLVAAGAAFLLATVRDDAAVPAPLVSLERSSDVRRLAIAPLDQEVVGEALAAALGGEVDGRTVSTLVAASRGNPLYLRELVQHARDSGALAVDDQGEWTMSAAPAPSRRLVDVIADRIGHLAEEQLRVAKVLALAAPVRWSSLERAGHGAATIELERLGVVTVDDTVDPLVTLAHPLHGDVLRGGLGVLERRRLLGEIVEWLDVPDATPDERLRIASWQLAIGRRPDLRTLEQGARRAWSARDHEAAERFARAALEERSSLAMAAVLVDSLIHTARSDEADSVAEGYLAVDDGSEPRDRSRLVGLRVFNDLWYRELPDAAAAVVDAEQTEDLDPIAADELFIQRAYVTLARADARAVLDLVEGREWTIEVAPQGLLLTAQMMADTGRIGDGCSVIEAAARATRVDAAMAVSTPGSIEAARVRLATLSGRLDEADELIAELIDRPVCRTDPFIHGYLLMSAGRIELLRGRPRSARRQFIEGRRIGEQQANRVTVMGCAAGLAVAAAHLGDAAACATLLAELESYELARVVRPSLATGIAWSLVTLGHPAQARTLLLDEAERSTGRRELSDAAALAFESARIGEATRARPLLEAVLPDVDGLARFLCTAGLALASGDAEELGTSESHAVELGLGLVAAELATAVARAHRRDGHPRAAAAAAARAASYLATCEGAQTPGVVAEEAISPLSDREREIACLAAGGLSNQEIADRLFLSVRTVGNHLQSAYTKLGVSGRARLTDVLGI